MSLETPLRSIHEKSGAQLSDWFGCLLPDSFSSLDAEYRAARDSVALFDTSHRAVARLEGADRVRFLNAICTSDIKGLADGHGCVTLLLNPQGHILSEFVCLALPESLLLITNASHQAATLSWLDKYLIMDDATITADSSLTSIAFEGPKCAALLYEACGLKVDAMPEYAHREIVLGAVTCRAVRQSHFGQPGVELIADVAAIPALWQTMTDAVRSHNGAPIGYRAINTLRLEAGIPWFGHDFDDNVIPHEAGLEFTHISYTKGCYTGQEIVERVRSRGHVNRRRTALAFSGSEPPAAGTQLFAELAAREESKEIGRVTSSAFSPALQRPIGFAYLRREFTAPGAIVHTLDGPAEVISIPLSNK
ncbi:MAG: aminomethyl transferase family protein [Acidobacteria bacterium]|nr:aminomethyl transferase family protein [Acidobacteriota bacterium]